MKITTIVYIPIVILLCACNNRTQSIIQCDDIPNKEIIHNAFLSFEKDIFTYYKLGNDTANTYKKFLSDVSRQPFNLNPIASPESIKIAHDFLKNSKTDHSLWISYHDYKQLPDEDKGETSIISELNTLDHETDKEKETRIEQEKNMLILNYKGSFIQCLKDNSRNNDLISIIDKLELIGPVNIEILAEGFNATDPKKTFNAIETKAFIAFEIYYYILMIMQR